MKFFSLRTALIGTVAITAAAFCVPTGRGAALVTYDFTDYTASTGSSAPNATLGTGILTATNFVANGGTVTPPTGFLGRIGSGSAGNYMFTTTLVTTAFGIQSQATYDTQANAITGATYYSFTITPTAGNSLSFPAGSTVTFQDSVRISTGGVNPYMASFFFQTDAATTGTFVTLGTPISQTQAAVGNTTVNQSVDLSSLGTLAAGQALTFRFSLYDNAQTTTNDIKFDNFVINGSVVAVPEPSAVALSGLGIVGSVLLTLRRRRQRA